MKRLIALILCGLVTFSSLATAGPPAAIAWQRDFRQAARMSARQKKPLLVVVTAPWCGYCHKMMRETFADRRVAEMVNSGYLPVLVDMDTNERLAGALRVEALPTTLVISPDYKVVSRSAGFQPAKELQATLIRNVSARVEHASAVTAVK